MEFYDLSLGVIPTRFCAKCGKECTLNVPKEEWFIFGGNKKYYCHSCENNLPIDDTPLTFDKKARFSDSPVKIYGGAK